MKEEGGRMNPPSQSLRRMRGCRGRPLCLPEEMKNISRRDAEPQRKDNVF
jgi:hypothetical protein